jgi:hypothetical protein
MAFVIESSSKLPFIHVWMTKIVGRSDVCLMQKQLRENLAGRRKHSCIYMGIDFSSLTSQEDLPLVPIISQFAQLYHESRSIYQLELLVVIDPCLMPAVRYIAESLVIPMLFFASPEALQTYVMRRNTDTQPFAPKDKAARIAATRNIDTWKN